jgi:hypothetical protein
MPVLDFFRNHAFAVIKPVRSIYKGREIGGNIRFVVDLVFADGKSEIIQLRREDWSLRRFRKFQLSQAALESATALSAFLAERQADGSLPCQTFQVFDADVWRADEDHQFYKGETIGAKYVGYLTFKIFGRLLTLRSDFKLRRENWRRAKGN